MKNKDKEFTWNARWQRWETMDSSGNMRGLTQGEERELRKRQEDGARQRDKERCEMWDYDAEHDDGTR